MLAIQQLVDVARRDGPELTQTEGLASVLFTDVEGSTVLAEALGDQKWSALIDDHFQTIADIVKEHRGQFVKSLGDGTLSCFSSANQALPYLIFCSRKEWLSAIKELYIIKPVEYFSSMAYFITGGISKKIPLPLSLYKILFKADIFLADSLPRITASFFTVHLIRK